MEEIIETAPLDDFISSNGTITWLIIVLSEWFVHSPMKCWRGVTPLWYFFTIIYITGRTDEKEMY